jgi:hypothetical protein
MAGFDAVAKDTTLSYMSAGHGCCQLHPADSPEALETAF